MTYDKRITERLVKYWRLLCKNNRFPEIQRFNTGAVEDVWPQCLTIGISISARRGIAYKYEYMGHEIIKAYGQDLTGITVDHTMKQFPGAIVLKKLDKIAIRHQIEFDEGHMISKDGKMIKYRACFLPFGNKKRGLTHIIIGLSFRVF